MSNHFSWTDYMVIRMVAVITLSLSLIFVTSTVSPQEIEQEQVDSEEWYDPYNWFDTNGQFSRAFVDSPPGIGGSPVNFTSPVNQTEVPLPSELSADLRNPFTITNFSYNDYRFGRNRAYIEFPLGSALPSQDNQGMGSSHQPIMRSTISRLNNIDSRYNPDKSYFSRGYNFDFDEDYDNDYVYNDRDWVSLDTSTESSASATDLPDQQGQSFQETREGTVVGLQQIQSALGQPDQVALQIRTPEGRVQNVLLGDTDYVRSNFPRVMAGDRVSFTGEMITTNNITSFRANEVHTQEGVYAIPEYQQNQRINGLLTGLERVAQENGRGDILIASVRTDTGSHVRVLLGNEKDLQRQTRNLRPMDRVTINGFVRDVDGDRTFVAQVVQFPDRQRTLTLER